MTLYFFIPFSLILGALFAYLLRLAIKHWSKKSAAPAKHHNIGVADRAIRLALALILLAYGIFQPSLWIFFASGFVFYEALAKWCVLYAALGKNTCPLN